MLAERESSRQSRIMSARKGWVAGRRGISWCQEATIKGETGVKAGKEFVVMAEAHGEREGRGIIMRLLWEVCQGVEDAGVQQGWVPLQRQVEKSRLTIVNPNRMA
jgi:hypothetical protein